ncbi:hypothetical protein BC567DRAFT_234255 [Phyllosticta citribraziliensis]
MSSSGRAFVHSSIQATRTHLHTSLYLPRPSIMSSPSSTLLLPYVSAPSAPPTVGAFPRHARSHQSTPDMRTRLAIYPLP